MSVTTQYQNFFILETQSVFVIGKHIIYNIMIVQEMFHALQTNPYIRTK